jgi:dTDP-4-dehydrorhamnose reductase
MKIVLFGKDGQLGQALQSIALPQDVTLIALGRDTANFEQPESLRKIIADIKPDIIINTAAYTQVDKAEEEYDLAHLINTVAPSVLAEEASKIGAWLIHYSTDYVFDGQKQGAYSETDTPAPLSSYGRTKHDGDQGISLHHDKYIIFRICWSYSQYGQNFVKTMLKLAQTKEQLKIVSDQIGAPTSALLIAKITWQMIEKINQSSISAGIYNLSASGSVSWYDYAKTLIQTARDEGLQVTVKDNGLIPVLAKDYGAKAIRPYNSCLDTSKLRISLGIDLPDWKEDVLSFAKNFCKTLKEKNGLSS